MNGSTTFEPEAAERIMHSYNQSVELLEVLYRQPLAPAEQAGLERAARLLRELGNPHRTFRSVHVAGSTGKGSTSSFISEVLDAAGRRTGTFRSPHLYSYLERISIGNQTIDDQQWIHAFNAVWPVVEAMRENRLSDYSLGRPSLFEVLFAIATVHFAENGLPWTVMEAGLGGRLDATNLLSPEVAVITNVSLEHTQVLGSTVSLIAVEKSAIVKAGSHAVTAAEGEAAGVIEQRCKDVDAPLLRVGREVQYVSVDQSLDGQSVTIWSEGLRVVARLQVAGQFQALNAATAAGAILALQQRGEPTADTAIAEGLARTVVPGRLERVSRSPEILLDGAHNPAGLDQLALALRDLVKDRPIVLLFACMSDKDVDAMAGSIAPVAEIVVTTCVPQSSRSASTSVGANAFQRNGVATVEEPDPAQALSRAISLAGSDRTVVVTGSLYLVGLVRHLLKLETIHR